MMHDGSFAVDVGSTGVGVEDGDHAMNQTLAIGNSSLLLLLYASQLMHCAGHSFHVVIALEVALVSPVGRWGLEEVFMPARDSADFEGEVSHLQHLVFPPDYVPLPHLV